MQLRLRLRVRQLHRLHLRRQTGPLLARLPQKASTNGACSRHVVRGERSPAHARVPGPRLDVDVGHLGQAIASLAPRHASVVAANVRTCCRSVSRASRAARRDGSSVLSAAACVGRLTRARTPPCSAGRSSSWNLGTLCAQRRRGQRPRCRGTAPPQPPQPTPRAPGHTRAVSTARCPHSKEHAAANAPSCRMRRQLRCTHLTSRSARVRLPIGASPPSVCRRSFTAPALCTLTVPVCSGGSGASTRHAAMDAEAGLQVRRSSSQSDSLPVTAVAGTGRDLAPALAGAAVLPAATLWTCLPTRLRRARSVTARPSTCAAHNSRQRRNGRAAG